MRLTHAQQQALSTLGLNLGEASEDTLWVDGLSRPRVTLQSLERRGMVRRGDFLNDSEGYIWHLVGGVATK